MVSEEAKRDTLRRLATDLDFLCRTDLWIRAKTSDGKPGGLVRFTPNRGQRLIMERAERQKREKGMVRAVVLKGRQMGSSTIIDARGYQFTAYQKHVNAQILSHREDATQNLFDMIKGFWEHSTVRPSLGRTNAKELIFDLMGSRYRVATAKAKTVGRSFTTHFLHWSEVAHSDNADGHQAGIVQTVPDLPGTEIWKESTANGTGNIFFRDWKNCFHEHSDYQGIFVPWFWSDEYRRTPPEKWEPSTEDQKLIDLYGLDKSQIFWRERKIEDAFGGDDKIFRQEYPNNPTEAFAAGGAWSIINAESVIAARARRHLVRPTGPLIMSIDPAEMGEAESVISYRRGPFVYDQEIFTKVNITELTQIAARRMRRMQPEFCVVDAVGVGAGLWSNLAALGFKVIRFHGGETAFQSDKYVNRRAEVWGGLRDEIDGWVSIPDDDMLQEQLTSQLYTYNGVNRRVLLVSKEQMMRDGLKSPDRGDSLSMLYASEWAPSTRPDAQLGGERYGREEIY